MLAKGYQIQIQYGYPKTFKWYDLFGEGCLYPTLRQALIKYNELRKNSIRITNPPSDKFRIVIKRRN